MYIDSPLSAAQLSPITVRQSLDISLMDSVSECVSEQMVLIAQSIYLSTLLNDGSQHFLKMQRSSTTRRHWQQDRLDGT